MLYLSATQSTSSLVLGLYSEHVRAISRVPPQTVKHAPAHGGHRHQYASPELAAVKKSWGYIHACCVQCCRPAMACQEATMLYLSATQSASSLVPDLHSEHFRATKPGAISNCETCSSTRRAPPLPQHIFTACYTACFDHWWRGQIYVVSLVPIHQIDCWLSTDSQACLWMTCQQRQNCAHHPHRYQ